MKNIKGLDGVMAKGSIRLTFIHNNKIFRELHLSNLVVSGGKHLVAQLLGGATTASVTKAVVGTNGATAQDSDSAITNGVAVNITSVSYPTSNQVLFGFSFTADLVAGMQIQEIGLATAAGTLFSRKALPLTNVPAGTNLDGSWLITVNA